MQRTQSRVHAHSSQAAGAVLALARTCLDAWMRIRTPCMHACSVRAIPFECLMHPHVHKQARRMREPLSQLRRGSVCLPSPVTGMVVRKRGTCEAPHAGAHACMAAAGGD